MKRVLSMYLGLSSISLLRCPEQVTRVFSGNGLPQISTLVSFDLRYNEWHADCLLLCGGTLLGE